MILPTLNPKIPDPPMRAAIFDMDGTLLDSMPMWRTLACTFLRRQGIEPSAHVIATLDSMGLSQSAKWLIAHYPIKMTVPQLESHFDTLAYEGYHTIVTPKPDVRRCLCALRRYGVRMSVATLTQHSLADEVLSRFGLADLFEHVLTVEDVGGVTKESPDLFLKAAALMQTSVVDCVVFEDSLYAVQTALSAGFPTWVIADAYAAPREADLRRVCTRYLSTWGELANELELPPGASPP